MPELPEVETVLCGLRQVLEGQVISSVSVVTPKLRNMIPPLLPEILKNRRVQHMYRRAKYMVWDIDNGWSVIVHLGMSGVFRTVFPDQGDGERFQKHDHLRLRLANGVEVVYRDPRRFGVLDLVPTGEVSESSYLAHLGAEPLERSFTARFLLKAIGGRKISIKQAIMDQSVVVGVGNIYASESLYLAGIDPQKAAFCVSFEEVERLVRAIRKVLVKAIEEGGSTLRDYRKIGGERGYFQTHFSVYDREGQPCSDCDCDVMQTGGVKRIVQGNRSTFYCPRKQA